MKFRSSFLNWIAAVAAMAGLGTLLFSGCASKKMGSTPLSAFNPDYFSDGAPTKAGEAFKPRAAASVGLGAEEIWVISRSSDITQRASDESPGSGALMARLDDREVAMPLKHTDVKASVGAYIASVDVLQQFQNPYAQKIEAVYLFPLPHNAAVNEFIMTIGDRRIRGIIREREQAEAIYAAARQQGYVASLLTEERPNIFRQSVANIEPGKEIDVAIKYFHTLEYFDGWYEFVFPMVVGPRFNPQGTTNGVGAVPQGAGGGSGQNSEVEYLKPGMRSAHDISLQVDVAAGVSIEEFRCATHDVNWERPADDRLTIRLKPSDNIPNRDFVLRYRVAGERIKSRLITHKDERGGFFTMMLYPPGTLENLSRQPLELVFVLDCSGSMHGLPIEQAKAAVERGLQLLRPGDSFQLIDFSERASQLGRAPLEATPPNVRRGLDYLQRLGGSGGTMMIEGIKAALDFPHDPRRLRFVCFLTDGFIGNEAQILSELQLRLGESRIFSFGVGPAPNRYLLDAMAKCGRGAVAYLGSRDSGAQVMEDFFRRISHPGLTHIKIDWGAMEVNDVYPRAIPDLFVGRPVLVTGRFQSGSNAAVRVTGVVGDEPVSLSVPVEVEPALTPAELPGVWARMKIADLETLSGLEDPDRTSRIKRVALDYGLMSAFTAFVAVDATRETGPSPAATVPIAVPVPEGVEYHTTVPGGSDH